jgi:JmjC domain, hydroxylase
MLVVLALRVDSAVINHLSNTGTTAVTAAATQQQQQQWYGVPGARCKKFEEVIRGHLRLSMQREPGLLYNITTMLDPTLLQQSGLEVHRLCQRAGEFVITFPKAYHAGIITVQ